jgi:alanine dehydrogenase
LTNATLKYGLQIAANGLEKAAKDNQAIALGVNCYCGKLTNKNVADAHKYEYTALDTII